MSYQLIGVLMGIGMLAGSVWSLHSMRGRSMPLISRVMGIAVSIAGMLIGLVLLYRAVTYEAPAGF